MIQSLFKYSLLLLVLISFFEMKSQNIVDECFFTPAVGPGFETTVDIANEPFAGADMVAYTSGTWQGGSGGANLSIDPPIGCTIVKAAFLRVAANAGEGIGFRIGTGLNPGTGYSVTFTYVSHGAGSDGTFQPKLYSSPGPTLFEEDVLQGSLIGSIPAANAEWETNTYTFTANGTNNGHTYLWLYADVSSGMVMNLCQMNAGELVIDLPSFLEACDGENLVLGDLSLEGANINWNSGANTPTINVTESGFYSVNANNICNSIADGVTVTFYEDPQLAPAMDTVLCLGTSFDLYTEGLNPENVWFDGSTDSTYTVTEPGFYSVTITDECGAAFYEIEVVLDSIPAIFLGADTALCFNEPHQLNALLNDPDATYLWSTGTEDPTLDVFLNESAAYSVEVTNVCGTGSAAIYVEYSLIPENIFADDYELCFGIPFELDVSFIEGDYTWKGGSSAPTTQIPSPGFYWVTIEDDDGCWEISDTTYVNVISCECPVWLPNSFTPNNDGNNDVYAPVFECAPYDYNLDIYDRWGAIIYTMKDPSESWNGRIAGEDLRDGIYAFQLFYRETYDGIPIIKIGHILLLNY